MRNITFFCATLVLTTAAYAAQTTAAQAACAKVATPDQLMEAGIRGEEAFAAMDRTELLKQAALAREEIIPCLVQALTPPEASMFHRLMALEAFTFRNEARVIGEFHAARKLDPGYEIPTQVFGPEHPLRHLYNKSTHAKDGKAEPIYAPKDGHVIVGGVRNAPRMSQTPAVIQVYGPDGEWIETAYIQPGEKLPVWGPNVFGVTAKELGVDTRPILMRPSSWYTLAGGVFVLGAGFYLAALEQKAEFEDPKTDEAELRGLYDRTNAFGTVSATAGVLAAGLTLTGVVIHIGFGEDDTPTTEVADE